VIHSEPPFELGQTLRGTDEDGNLINGHHLGTIYTFPSQTMTANLRGGKARRTGKPIVAVALRNESGGALLPKRIARLTRTAGYSLCESADGYAAGTGEQGANTSVAFIDEFLPSAGVADDDIFWGIIGGPVTVLTPIADTDFGSDIAVADLLVSVTGTTTGATTSGRIGKPVFVNATAGGTQAALNGYRMAVGVIARALSARTTGNTATDVLVDACVKLF
jgi:hypothetical protein